MKFWLTALILALALVAMGWIAVRRAHESRVVSRHPFPAAAIAKTKRIELTTLARERVVLENRGGNWQMTAPEAQPVEPAAVTELLQALADVTLVEVATVNANSLGALGLADHDGERLMLRDSGGATLADVAIGRQLGQFTLLRIAGSKEVWKAAPFSPELLKHSARDWRDHRIFDFPAADAERMIVEGWGQRLEIERLRAQPPNDTGGGWQITSGSGGAPRPGEKLDQRMVRHAIRDLSVLHTDDFAEGSTADEVRQAPDALKITVRAGGRPHSLIIGPGKGEQIWVVKEGSPLVFRLQRSMLLNLARPPLDYGDKMLLNIPEAALAEVDIRHGVESGVLRRSAAGWSWKPKGKSQPAPGRERMLAYASSLENVVASGFARESDSEKLGLRQPAAVLVFKQKDQSTVTLQFGAVANEAGDRFVQRLGAPRTWVLKRYLVDLLLTAPLALTPTNAAIR